MTSKPILTIFEARSGAMKYTRLFIFTFLFSILSLSTQFSMAQMVATPEPFDNGAGATDANGPQADPGDGPPDPCTSPDQYCPIDGGLAFLIAAGIGLAGRRAHQQKKITRPI